MSASTSFARWCSAVAMVLLPSFAAGQTPQPDAGRAAATKAATVRVANADATALRQSLQQIAARRADGDRQPLTLVLPAGRYQLTETLHVEPETVGEGLTLRADKPEQTILSGGTALEPLDDGDAATWRYRLPAGWNETGIPRAVLIEGRLRTAARHPNEGYLRIESALPDRRSGFTAREADIPKGLDVTAAPCDLVLLHDWSSSRIPVASYDPASRQLRTVGPIGCAAPHYAIDHFEKHPRYWLEGHPDFADQPREWYIDRTAGQLVMVADASNEQAAAAPPEVILPKLETLLTAGDIDGQPAHGLVLEGLTFAHSRFPMPAGGLAGAQASMHEIRQADGSRSDNGRPFLSAAVRIDHAADSAVRRCRFQGLGNSGLWIGGRTSRCEVHQCRFEDLGGNGLNLGEDHSRRVQGQLWYQGAPQQIPTNNRVTDCQISRCGQILPGAVAVWCGLHKGLEITGTHIHDCPYTGISLGWIWNDTETPARENNLHDNHIEHVMQVLSDGGGIYTLGRQPDTQLHHNLITDVPLNAGRAESNGMFLDEGSTGLTIHHNTFRRLTKSPLRFHRAGTNWVRENRWELSQGTPPIRYNNTPEANIHASDNTVIAPQTTVFLIGNSLTWDTVPSRLDGHVEWHVDCGKSLQFIHDHPADPCVDSSVLWPRALRRSQFDFVTVQPHYGTTLQQDVEVIAEWMQMQPKAVFVIHSGWARQATRAEEYTDGDPAGPMVHSPAYFQALIDALRQRFPDRKIRSTRTTELLRLVATAVEADRAPVDQLSDLYRDPIHMTLGRGRYLMHNAMRLALGQPLSSDGLFDVLPEWKTFANQLLSTPLGGN